MRILLIIFLLLSFTSSSYSESRIKIAVIDTGILKSMEDMDFMCRDGVKDFTDTNPYDLNGHGSNIVGIIGEAIDTSKYCIQSLKFYKYKKASNENSLFYLRALVYVSLNKDIKYLNLSLGGKYPINDLEGEVLFKILSNKTVVAAAAGNNGDDLDTKEGKFFPASFKEKSDFKKFKNFFVVGSELKSSNHGSIVTDVFSGTHIKPDIKGVRAMSGTSQATAQKLADILKSDGINK